MIPSTVRCCAQADGKQPGCELCSHSVEASRGCHAGCPSNQVMLICNRAGQSAPRRVYFVAPKRLSNELDDTTGAEPET